jgi:hypothetical protein
MAFFSFLTLSKLESIIMDRNSIAIKYYL